MRHLSMLLVLVCCATALAAQGPAPAGLSRNASTIVARSGVASPDTMAAMPPLARSNASAPVARLLFAGDSARRGSHWKTGMVVGGGVGLLLAYAASHIDLEPDSRSTGEKVRGWVLPIAVFAMAGGLIGSLFH